MESGRWMDSFCHSMQRQEDSPPATDCRLGDGPRISIHVLVAERDRGFSAPSAGRGWNFNRRSPYGERRCRWASRRADICHFNPRSPHGERLDLNNQRGLPLNFNPRSPHGERLRCRLGLSGSISISIHALLTESDFATFRFVIFHIDFNPRSPHGERRVAPYEYVYSFRFQSTLSSRRATPSPGSSPGPLPNFNPRSPHGERHSGQVIAVLSPLFQSTLSSRRATSILWMALGG